MAKQPRDGASTRAARWVILAALVIVALLYFTREQPTTKPNAGASSSSGGPSGVPNQPWKVAGGDELPAASGVASMPPIVPPAIHEAPMPAPTTIPYSPDTFALNEAIVPGSSAWDEVPSDPEGTFMIRVKPVTYVFRAPEPIVIEMIVVDRKGVKQSVTKAEAQLKSANPALDKPAILIAPFAGGAGKPYLAKFELDKDQRDMMMGHVMVMAQVQLATGKSYFVSTSLTYTRNPDARIIGKYKDELRNGALYIAMSVQVDVAGMYQVRGELFGPNYEPIAETRTVSSLSTGEQRVELHFYGKALFDKAVDGPYRLRYLYISQQIPGVSYDAMSPVIDDAHTTAAYKATSFSSAPYEAPAIEGEQIGPDHPSQKDKPPPLFANRPDHPSTAPIGSGSTMAMGHDVVPAASVPGAAAPGAAPASSK